MPEINLGQLALLLRGRFLIDVICYNRVRGLPFEAVELASAIEDVIGTRPFTRKPDRKAAAGDPHRHGFEEGTVGEDGSGWEAETDDVPARHGNLKGQSPKSIPADGLEASISPSDPDSGLTAISPPEARAPSRRVRDAVLRKHLSVFVSYSHPDSRVVETLIERLSEAGVNVSWDMDLPAGANFSEVLVDAIGRSDIVIAVVSPDYLASDWAQGELAAALSSQKRVLPVLVRPTTVEGPLRYIQFLDATPEPQLAGDKVIQLLIGAP